MTKRTKRSGTFWAGLVATFVGVILGVAGITTAPAGADKPGTFKITICHRTNAPTNPYRVIEVSVDAGNGELVGPDHTGHPGPVFDFTADPADPAYPYDSPRNGDQWGDIIPPYEFDGGSYPGMNWPDGQAVWEADCQGPQEPPDETCPAGQVWDDKNDDAHIDEGECVTPFECPEDTTWVDANDNGIEEEGECEEAEVLPNVITPTPTPEAAPEQLPRTGSNDLPLTMAGLGLILLGLGAVSTARERRASS